MPKKIVEKIAEKTVKVEKKVEQPQEVEQPKVVAQPVPKPATPLVPVEVSLKKKSDMMQDHLEKQTKVMIMIPLEKGEKAGALHPFCINGYRFKVPKGRMTQVPEQVAGMVAERFNVELEVRGKAIGQSDNGKREALNL